MAALMDMVVNSGGGFMDKRGRRGLGSGGYFQFEL
jgi:hypothetical protein